MALIASGRSRHQMTSHKMAAPYIRQLIVWIDVKLYSLIGLDHCSEIDRLYSRSSDRAETGLLVLGYWDRSKKTKFLAQSIQLMPMPIQKHMVISTAIMVRHESWDY